MTKSLYLLTRQQIALYICYAMTVALIYSKFSLTIGMALLVLIALLSTGDGKTFRLKLNPDLANNFKKLWDRKDFLVITLFFFLVLCSGLYTSDFQYFGERLRIKLPFLLLPFAFVSLPSFSERQYLSVFYVFLVAISFSALMVLSNYILDYDAINLRMGQGQVMPTPTNHIRYSLLTAFGILSGIVLCWKSYYLKYKWETYVLGALSLFLLIFIHILSVRSGLLVFYASMFLLTIRWIFLSKRYILGMLIILSLSIAPVIAFMTLPSLNKKIRYMLYDYDQYRLGEVKNLSDAERFISMYVGWEIGSQSPLLGVGAGDLKETVAEIYQERYPDLDKPKMPHNQFLSVYAGTGLIGLALFLIAFFYPLFYRQNYQDVLLTMLHVILFCSFMMENTLETAVGVAFYTLFLMLGLARR